MRLFKTILNSLALITLLFSASAWAGPKTITFQTKILLPSRAALESSSVQFQITTLDPLGTCVLYVETFSGISMVGSGGVSVLKLGSGTSTFSAAGTDYINIFNNSAASYACQTGGTYTPGNFDQRKIVMQFNDGSAVGWQTTPAIEINSVPYSLFADDALKFSGHGFGEFALNSAFPNCSSTGKVLTFNGATFSCVASTSTWADAGSGKINYNGGYVGIGTATPSANLEIAGTIKITGGTPGSGKVLTSDAAGLASWVTPAAGNSGTVTSVTSANSYLSVATTTSTPVITANVGTAANTLAAGNDSRLVGAIQQSAYNNDISNVLDSNCAAGSTAKWNVSTDMWACVAISGLDAAVIATGTVAAARLPSSATFWNDAGSGKINYNGGNVGIGTATPSSALNVRNGSIVTDSVNSSVAYINFGVGNVQMSSTSATTINICGLKDGGSYTLVLTGIAADTVVIVNAYPNYDSATSCSGTPMRVDLGGGETQFNSGGATNILSFVYFSARGANGTVYGFPTTNYVY